MTDLRFAFRQLLRNPGFTAVVVLTLALGIGANTTIFSITNGLLLRPLPVSEPERLLALFTTYEKQSGLNGTSHPDYRDLRDRNDVFEGLAGHFYFPMAVRTADRAEVVLGHVVSGNYFEVLGVSPAMGRAFLPEEDQAPGARSVAMLSYRPPQQNLWVRMVALRMQHAHHELFGTPHEVEWTDTHTSAAGRRAAATAFAPLAPVAAGRHAMESPWPARRSTSGPNSTRSVLPRRACSGWPG